MATETTILIGVGIYVILIMLIGFYASRSNQSLTDFVVAGRNIPLWLCSVSVFATWFGSGIMMGAATAAYEFDTILMIGEPYGSGLALLLTGMFFARMYRRTRRLTWPEFFEARYGKGAAVFASIADIIGGTIWLGGILFAFGVLLESLAGIPLVPGVIGGTLVVVTYTMIGGMWAVALTDFVQMTVFVIGLFILLFVALGDAGGWAAISAELPEHAMRMMPVEHTVANWMDHIHVWLALGVAGMAASSVIQRALSARSEAVAQNAFYIAAVAYIIIGSIPIVLGFVASVTMPGIEDPNAILTDLAVVHLHPVLVAVFVGAIVSAGMSSSDSILLGNAAIVSTNLLPLVVKDPSEKLRLSVVRYSIPVIAMAAAYVAFNADRAVQVIIDSTAVLLAGIIVPFIACFWWPKANRSGALAAIILGCTAWFIADFMSSVVPADLIGFAVAVVTMIVVTLLTQKSDPPRPLTDDEGNALELKDRFGRLGLRS